MCCKGEKSCEAKLEPGVESSLSNINFSQFFLQTTMVIIREAQ